MGTSGKNYIYDDSGYLWFKFNVGDDEAKWLSMSQIYYAYNKVNAIDGNYLPLSGGTLTGGLKIAQGDSCAIQLGTLGRINATDSSGNSACTVLGMNNDYVLLGHSSFPLTVRGKGNMTYNGNKVLTSENFSLSGTTLTITT